MTKYEEPPALDITKPTLVEILIKNDGKVIWVNVDGICCLRACGIEMLRVEDQRIAT